MNQKSLITIGVFAVTGILLTVYYFGVHHGRTGEVLTVFDNADAAVSSPVKALEEQEVYYPGTEDIAPDEMRVVACGTGMPNSRPKQAAACFLVELGNGDKFIFDIGSGSAERLSAMKIPYDYLVRLQTNGTDEALF